MGVAQMQIVINISREDYDDIRFEKCVCDYMQVEIGKAIINGTTLPEGHWKNGFCSECGEHALYPGMSSGYYQTNFCPNCGAKMKIER